jgi:hypothetical protein
LDDEVVGESVAVVALVVGAWEPLVVPLAVAVGWLLAVVVGGGVVGGVVDGGVVGGAVAVELALVVGLAVVVPPPPPPLLPPPPDVGVPPPVLAGMPPCSVTTIPPGLNTIRAAHSPLGAPLVAVAVTVTACPAASVPELRLSVSQDTEGAADQFSGPVPVLRNRICTLFGSPSRWLTLT